MAKFQFQGQIIFFLMKQQTSVIPLFHVILTEKYYCWYYFNDSSSFSRSKGQFQGQIVENIIFSKHN